MVVSSSPRQILPSSFRDRSGCMLMTNGTLYRQVNRCYQKPFDHLMQSGLYEALTDAGMLIRHEEVREEAASPEPWYKLLQPEMVPFISYPYEWCFSQLKAAALLTLQIQRKALAFGMSLKDASAYNIQFLHGKPILIDTLSFNLYQEGALWVAYRQFCEHFLAPLALMSYTDVRLNQLLKAHIDGIPLDQASVLLPLRTRLHPGLLAHLHLHAAAQKRLAHAPGMPQEHSFSLSAMVGFVEQLEGLVQSLHWKPRRTAWSEYYSSGSHALSALKEKEQWVDQFLTIISPTPQSVWDVGANTGYFSRLASQRGILTVSMDADPSCVEKNFLDSIHQRQTQLLPLWMDLFNPSPSLGWNSQERLSLIERGPADVLLALALIHHWVVDNNLPLGHIAEFFSRLCRRWLLIEYVPKDDPQMQRILRTRQDDVEAYTQEDFEAAFGGHFSVVRKVPLATTGRTLYLMQKP